MNIKFNFFKGRQKIIFLTVFILIIISASLVAQRLNPKVYLKSKRQYRTHSLTDPIVEYAVHNRGNMQLAVANNGTFGTLGQTITNPSTGEPFLSCIYPKNSNIVNLWVGALWIGAVVGRDTLVSCANEDFYRTTEFWPDIKPFGDFRYKSIDPNSGYYADDAYSEEDILCEYTDTVTNPNLVEMDPTDHRPHKPLGLKVYQRSMSWSYSYADDFILFDYKIENIGINKLRNVYMGIYIDGDVWHISRNGPEGWNDDIVGFYPAHDFTVGGCTYTDSIKVAYTADNDGDPENGQWNEKSARSAVGVRVVRTPSDSLRYSFNWWITNYNDPAHDFGPRRKGTPGDPYRDFGPRMGTPEGDNNKYYVMRHNEFDYDLLFTAVDHSFEGWLPPPKEAVDYATGYDTRYLLSFGPFDINPGERLPIDFAWVGGENFHVNPTDFDSFDPHNPQSYYNKLNFTPFATNSRWASWVYDNPGVDTDSDGYRGEFVICVYDSTTTPFDTTINGHDTTIVKVDTTSSDTIWVKGDGVPDFRGASPPPAPKFWVYTDVGSLTIRFNGALTENSRDKFSGLKDFEGYRIYLARDNRSTSYSVIASYDKKDYNKYVWDEKKLPAPGFTLFDPPFTIEQLQCLYGDSCGDKTFNPLSYTPSSPYIHPLYPDSIFYFIPQDYNASDFGITTQIKKRFPHQPYPSNLNPDSARPDEVTEDGYLKYYEYEYTISNLLPTVSYWVNVTAFDFGSPQSGLTSLETPVSNGAQEVYPLSSTDLVKSKYLKAYVYPNPYRSDAGYDDNGYENRGGYLAKVRARRIHFANLPNVCKISIYSLDGDLIKTIEHNYPNGGPEAMHETWDLITRNTQAIVSGLYYYVIESKDDTQIGKLVIIE